MYHKIYNCFETQDGVGSSAWAWSPSQIGRRTCLQTCCKKHFKAINIFMVNSSYEISLLVTVTTIWRPSKIQTSSKKS